MKLFKVLRVIDQRNKVLVKTKQKSILRNVEISKNQNNNFMYNNKIPQGRYITYYYMTNSSRVARFDSENTDREMLRLKHK